MFVGHGEGDRDPGAVSSHQASTLASERESRMENSVCSMYMDIVQRGAVSGSVYRVTIAANEKVRQPPDLEFGGLSTENYARNPVVMWAHDVAGRSPSGGLPIGRTLRLDKTPEGRMVVDFEFLDDDPFAQRVKNAWDKGFLRAASISWIPLESGPAEGGRWRDTKSDLLEWSIVSVPADPHALRKAHRRMMEDYFAGEASSESGWEAAMGQHSPPERSFTAATNTVEAGSENDAAMLSVDDREGLAEILRLLRLVAQGLDDDPDPSTTRPAANSQRSSLGERPVEELSDADLTEIRGAVESILVSLEN